ncbi:MAG: hypothetical protein EHM93_00415 [Bacteroidales bacterium]|nr:MAG: hypothetical protein EHM93_00415 [Bacteroidales bacterium]
MKVAVLTHEVVDNKLVFNVERQVEEKSFDELDAQGKFSENLKTLNIQRFIIRKSKEIDKVSLNKEFRR